MEQYLTTDPYSKCTTSDGERTVICDLNHSSVVPKGWHEERSPKAPEDPVDITLYELHTRDFSITDKSVPDKLRGKFGAFNKESLIDAGYDAKKAPYTNGLKHLKVA